MSLQKRRLSSHLPPSQSNPLVIRLAMGLLLAFELSPQPASPASSAQGLGNSGSIQGSVLDPSGAAIPGATVEIHNPVSGFERSTSTDAAGRFEFTNVPFNPYHLSVGATGFETSQRDLKLNSSVPMEVILTLQIKGGTTTVTVHSEAGDLIEQSPSAHTDVDRSLIEKLPIGNQSIGLSDVITNATPGVAADANGFFHPFGDHAQASISLDNQPITDQYSKLFSNQISLDAIQSMEVIAGVPPAEYGDKTSLVINAVTRSGLGQLKPTGSFSAQYGSFGTTGLNFAMGVGGKKWGNFLATNLTDSSRFLDSPEFAPFHDRGNGESFFDRVDFNPSAADTLHLNLSAGRSWFQTPNTYDQTATGQDQHQQIRTMNIAPGWTHLFGPTLLLTVNPYFRLDHVQYYPSRDPFHDTPATLAQDRRLAVAGIRTDLSYSKGIHNAKAGVQFRHNFLTENFNTGLTDPTFNPVCLDPSGNPVTDPAYTNADQCAAAGFEANPNLSPGLVPYDLTRGGQLFDFHGRTDIKELALYAQDMITLSGFTFNLGTRGDIYRGLSRANQVEPRVGISYLVRPTTTVLRVSYGRFLETPYNENLILSSMTGAGGLAGNVFGAFGSVPLDSGRRNQFNAGLQQPLGRWAVIDADYFWKFTRNGYDFDALFDTPLAFPISWHKSKIDGVAVRVNLTSTHGFTAYTVMGHTRSRFFGPENGGLIFNSPLSEGAFRIDHDQAFEQSTHVQYQFPKKGPWVAFTWRYDSGMVAGAVPDFATALGFDADQQAAIGLYCGNNFATLTNRLTSCNLPYPLYGATRLVIPAPGTANVDTNPPRVAPRHLFDLAVGFDNLFHTDRRRVTLKLSALNLADTVALYNFLSTFSGTHFVAPRTLMAELGFTF
jgi:hypothetical protein